MKRVAILLLMCVALAGGASPMTADRKIDEFGNIRCGDEMARLDNYAIALQNEPGATGYIFVYAGRRSRRGEARARLARVKDHLVRRRGLSEGRIHFIDGGYREELTVDLYIIPAGAIPPTASPTVDPAEVQIRPGKIRKSELRCGGRR